MGREGWPDNFELFQPIRSIREKLSIAAGWITSHVVHDPIAASSDHYRPESEAYEFQDQLPFDDTEDSE